VELSPHYNVRSQRYRDVGLFGGVRIASSTRELNTIASMVEDVHMKMEFARQGKSEELCARQISILQHRDSYIHAF
jgi:hypothetical protein